MLTCVVLCKTYEEMLGHKWKAKQQNSLPCADGRHYLCGATFRKGSNNPHTIHHVVKTAKVEEGVYKLLIPTVLPACFATYSDSSSQLTVHNSSSFSCTSPSSATNSVTREHMEYLVSHIDRSLNRSVNKIETTMKREIDELKIAANDHTKMVKTKFHETAVSQRRIEDAVNNVSTQQQSIITELPSLVQSQKDISERLQQIQDFCDTQMKELLSHIKNSTSHMPPREAVRVNSQLISDLNKTVEALQNQNEELMEQMLKTSSEMEAEKCKIQKQKEILSMQLQNERTMNEHLSSAYVKKKKHIDAIRKEVLRDCNICLEVSLLSIKQH